MLSGCFYYYYYYIGYVSVIFTLIVWDVFLFPVLLYKNSVVITSIKT